MTKELATTFDYGTVDKDTKAKLISLAGQFNRAVAAHHKTWLELGEPIAVAHELLAGNGRDGKFSQWVEAELSVGKKTAYRYKHAWERFGNKRDSVSHFSTEAIYALSAPAVPDKAVRDALKLADKGKRINLSVADELIEKYTVEAEQAEESPVITSNGSPAKPADEPVSEVENKSPPSVCPNGGDHEWGPDDEGGVCCQKCHDPKPADPGPQRSPASVAQVEAQSRQAAREIEEPPAGKLFSKLLEHLRQSVLLLDEINKVAPNPKARQEIFDSLECANQDILKWRKAAK